MGKPYMSLINCKKCGILFKQKLRPVCDKCLSLDNENINKITAFTKAWFEKFVSMETISKELKIDIHEIEEFYKNGNLYNIADKLTSKCKICGIEVKVKDKKGHFCQKCYQQMLEENEKKPLNNPTNIRVPPKKNQTNKPTAPEIGKTQNQIKYGFKKPQD